MAKKQKVTMYAQGDLLEAPVAIDEDALPPAPVVKEKKPRTPAQIAATAKLLALNKEKKRLRDEEKAKETPTTPANSPSPIAQPAPVEGEVKEKKKRVRKPKAIPVAEPAPTSEEVPPQAPVPMEEDGTGADTVLATDSSSANAPTEEPKAKRVKKNPKVKGAVSLNSIAVAPAKPKVPSETNTHFMMKLLEEQNSKIDKLIQDKEKRRIEKDAEREQINRIKSAGKQSWDERNDHYKKQAGDNIDNLTASIFKKSIK